MRIETLSYILTISELGSISKAAERINIQQTSLSAALRSLENELGFRIFKRMPYGVVLTEKGAAVMEIARRMLADHEKLLSVGRLQSNAAAVYVNPSVYSMFFTEIYKKFCQLAPDFRLDLYKIPLQSFWNVNSEFGSVHKFGIDLCRTSRLDEMVQYCAERDIVAESLMKTELRAYFNRSNPLSKRDAITLDMLRGERLLLNQSIEKKILSIDPDFRNYSIIENAGAHYILSMVNDANAVAICPDEKTIPKDAISKHYANVIPVHIHGGHEPDFTFTQCLIYRRDIRLSKTENLLLRLVRQTMHD